MPSIRGAAVRRAARRASTTQAWTARSRRAASSAHTGQKYARVVVAQITTSTRRSPSETAPCTASAAARRRSAGARRPGRRRAARRRYAARRAERTGEPQRDEEQDDARRGRAASAFGSVSTCPEREVEPVAARVLRDPAVVERRADAAERGREQRQLEDRERPADERCAAAGTPAPARSGGRRRPRARCARTRGRRGAAATAASRAPTQLAGQPGLGAGEQPHRPARRRSGRDDERRDREQPGRQPAR